MVLSRNIAELKIIVLENTRRHNRFSRCNSDLNPGILSIPFSRTLQLSRLVHRTVLHSAHHKNFLAVRLITLLLKVRCQLSVLIRGPAVRFKSFPRKRHLENLAVPQHFKKSPFSCRTLKVHYPVYSIQSLVPCLNQLIPRLTSHFFKIDFYIINRYRSWFKN